MTSAPDVVLDTHAVLWWFASDRRLSKRARAAIDSAVSPALSAISAWEVAMLVAKARVELDRPVTAWVHDLETAGGIAVLPISGSIAVLAGELEEFHGDPADRLIVATAIEARATLVTKDARIRKWAARWSALGTTW